MNRPRTPDFDQFLTILRRTGRPDHLPFYEHIASPGFIARATNTPFEQMSPQDPQYWKIYVEFWINLGFDCVPLEIAPNLSVAPPQTSEHKESNSSESHAVIFSMADFEQYPWPDPDHFIDYHHFETAARFLPEGAKFAGGIGGGPYEWTTYLLGVMGLSIGLLQNPELVSAVFERIGRLYHEADKRLAQYDFIGVLRQGDDLGFKTSTFLSPQHLRQYVFPIYKNMAQVAHDTDRPFILHSCGNLAEVYDDLIDYCKIDAKHSFEDVILPVNEFKKQYGKRITPLGGLDVDKICRSNEAELRQYTRQMVEACFAEDGWWALGTGNSLTNYMPVENYLTVLDEGRKVAGN